MSKDKTNSKNWRSATKMVRGGTRRSGFDETSEAIFLTSGYVYETAEEAESAFKGELERFIYSRYHNPTVAMFEERMALLEGAGFCFGTSSGMAAVYAALASGLKAGDRIVSARALFGSCHYIVAEELPRFGIETEFVDGTDLEQWRTALSKPAAAVFLETPSNPALEVIDIAAVSELAHGAGARVVIDNVFATPVLQKPLQLGADVVVYSATKHIDGQGRTMGGVVLTNDKDYVEDLLMPFLRHTGPSLSPFNAWTLLKGLETIDLRVRRMSENALKVAGALESIGGVKRVIYPGLASHPQHALAMSQMDNCGSTIVAFNVAGGRDDAFKVLNGLNIIDISNNLGDAKSMVTHPATTTHRRLSDEERAEIGIGDGLIRLSVGLEDTDDLIEDLTQALK
ncbi:MAG: O-succinylhomoserine sulfhydrylase [Rhodospirillaceae bacterium]|jgi:O-succinylhomoserine sulfhydrylase|nr:O-succinylhomoserine sulfhydrylase [Rhodospirillaceae bacterium]MBT4220202.1 O-succinylhomoserine sulfhydrylase [Rhodospirillaceae bacterium]MBT4463428.1 O-succinylhomoserine sulfhydrylase [Rhodospirillaceae bacterium]MBT5012898.1 O-succinylhomoserine sulfhydrylase [Rhodospirillaceae bacterium]MBT6407424.1 O-succinylhomoserine sulfhydrylase [Rhodospirillaceae bacterium]